MTTYAFGFLKYKREYHFAGIEVVPAEVYDNSCDWIDRNEHKDGFVYPPMGWRGTDDGEKIPKTYRPMHQHHLPPTHEMRLAHCNPSDSHRIEASAAMQLVACLHGTWLQFEDWWFDARVPIHCRERLHCTHETAEHFLAHAFQTWTGWPTQVRQRFVTLLYLYNRAPSYEWEWERFFNEYIVLDAIYKTAIKLNVATECNGHGGRIKHLVSTFGLAGNDVRIEEFVRLRNELFHEGIWDGMMPGYGGSAQALLAPIFLRRLNLRLILAILGYSNEFMHSAWWVHGARRFDRPA